MKKLEALLQEVERTIPHYKMINKSVSDVSVGWHIEHLLLVLNSVIHNLQQPKQEKYQWKFNLIRIMVFTVKNIPRKKGKSPKRVLPKEYDEKSLLDHLEKTRETIKVLPDLDKKLFFIHLYFGHLKLKKTITFLEIHTNHHLKIIKDIIAK